MQATSVQYLVLVIWRARMSAVTACEASISL
jgi:hypothetical protein